MAEQVVSEPVVPLAQSEIRRAWYIKSMQSERVKVLIGTTKYPFEVPYDLLAQYSTNFKKLRNALNDSGDEIVLPDVTKSTFEDFFIWIHAFEPSLVQDESLDNERINRALKLAVFAQKYQIYHLRNQSSDVVREALLDEQWTITPEMISAVYKVAPAGSALRQLSFLGFVAAEGRNDSTLWQAAFIECPDLGWDYFQFKSGSEAYSEGIGSGGACRFHDHSDIRGWVLQNVPNCPYPHGAPRLIPEAAVSTPVPTPVVHDIFVPGAVDTSHVETESGSLPSVAEVVEPVSAKAQPAGEPLPELAIEQPSGTECWASETTETEPVEPEAGKFEPQEEPLLEEDSVGTWVSKTKEAEPVEEPVEEPTVVESVPVEVPRHVTAGTAHIVVDKDPVRSKVTVKRISIGDEASIEKEVPAAQQIPVVDKTPTAEEADPIEELSSPMQRIASVDQSPNAQKKKKKRGGKKGV